LFLSKTSNSFLPKYYALSQTQRVKHHLDIEPPPLLTVEYLFLQ
jgi:hypothetical protein